jgi:hypothetical protein
VGGVEDNGDERMNIKRPGKIRQCINGELIDTYRTIDIDPLLDDLERLRSQVNLDSSKFKIHDDGSLEIEAIMPTGTNPFPT